MEFRIGQEMHIGPDISGIIFHTNETQVSLLNYNKQTKFYYKTALNSISKLGNKSFKLQDEISSDMKDTYDKAMEMKHLMETYKFALV